MNNKGFVQAGELKVGDELVDVNNNILLIEDYSVEIPEEPTTVYNFMLNIVLFLGSVLRNFTMK